MGALLFQTRDAILQQPISSPPTIRNITTAHGTGATTVINVPAGTVNGDELLLIACSESGGTLTNHASWTLDQAQSASTGLYRRTAASEPASYSIAHSSGFECNLVMICITGTSGKDVSAIGTTASGTTHVAPTVTTTVDNDLVLRVSACNPAGAQVTQTWPTSVEVVDYGPTTGGTSVATATKSPAGATGTETSTSSASASAVRYTIAYKP